MSIGSTSILAAFRPVDNRPCRLFHPMAREGIRFDQRLADPLTPLRKKTAGTFPVMREYPPLCPAKAENRLPRWGGRRRYHRQLPTKLS